MGRPSRKKQSVRARFVFLLGTLIFAMFEADRAIAFSKSPT
ncbi:MAG TPA: hypothetical protein VFK05_30085 [Polyangiaceae bacterium]|nr:hypothetical protein [Polyangiaceae bacterium]